MYRGTEIASPKEMIETYNDLKRGVTALSLILLLMSIVFGWVTTRDRREDSAAIAAGKK